MKSTALVISLLLYATAVQCKRLSSKKPSDMEVGTLGPDDQLLGTLSADMVPSPVDHYDEIYIPDRHDSGIYTYIIGVESGRWPGARIRIVEGGPGYDNYMVAMDGGKAQGYNYTIHAYGKLNKL